MMGAADGQVIGVSTIVDSGPASKRWNMVLVAEGYRQAELPRFRADVAGFRDHLFGIDPFSRSAVRGAINIFAVEVASAESGADHPACGSAAASRHASTYFDARFCYDGRTQRLLAGDGDLAVKTVKRLVPGWHQILVLVNDPDRGGAGGSVAWTCNSSADWQDIAIHELGHSAFGLADEYDYDGPARWPGGEPSEPNVSAEPDPYRLPRKWAHLCAAGLPAPARQNPAWNDPNNREDPGPDPYPTTTVGTFEGARYSGAGIYRPMWDCKMRHTAAPFCAVCTERILTAMAPFQAP
jgi:hypothetical protein